MIPLLHIDLRAFPQCALTSPEREWFLLGNEALGGTRYALHPVHDPHAAAPLHPRLTAQYEVQALQLKARFSQQGSYGTLLSALGEGGRDISQSRVEVSNSVVCRLMAAQFCMG